MNTSPNQTIRVYQQLWVMPLTEEINKDRGCLQKCPLPPCSFSILPRPIQGINFALNVTKYFQYDPSVRSLLKIVNRNIKLFARHGHVSLEGEKTAKNTQNTQSSIAA